MAHHAAYGLTIDQLDVMIIEQSRTAQTMLRSMLAAQGAGRIRSADTVAEALQMMIAEPPNLVLTAWDLGQYSGAKLLNVIRHKRMEPLCYLPVIVITAHATLRIVDEAFSAGCTNILVKPVSPAALLRRVEWVTSDNRQFGQDGNKLAIDGVQKILDTRVRKRRLSTIIASNAAVDSLLEGDIDTVLDDYEDLAALGSAMRTQEKKEKPADDKFKPVDSNQAEESNPYWYGWDIGVRETKPSSCQRRGRAA
ncbi:MAG: response regulator [Pseudomonadota bacterium]